VSNFHTPKFDDVLNVLPAQDGWTGMTGDFRSDRNGARQIVSHKVGEIKGTP
jgi:hypothetical protein